MGQKQNKQSEAVLYEKYVPPVINEDDIASPDEIKEILKNNVKK